MNKKTTIPPFPLFNCFNELKQAGFPLSPADYQLFLQALSGGFGIESKNALLFLCQKLWLKNLTDTPTFNQIVTKYIAIEIDLFKVKEARQETSKTSSKKSPNDKKDFIKKDKPNEEITQPKYEEEERPKATQRTKEDGPTVTLSVEDVPVGEEQNNASSDTHIRPEERFILSGSYLTLRQRDAETAWRFLRQDKVRTRRKEMDIKATIKHIAKKGYFETPIYNFTQKSRAGIYVLVDHQGSMVAFKSLANAIINAASAGGRIKVERAYFKNVPSKTVFSDWYHTKAMPLQEFINKASREEAALLIISDAGAARGRYNDDRVDATEDFYLAAEKKVKQIAWLNPLPKDRWGGTSAQYIADFIPMFETTQQGLTKAIDVLRNKMNTV